MQNIAGVVNSLNPSYTEMYFSSSFVLAIGSQIYSKLRIISKFLLGGDSAINIFSWQVTVFYLLNRVF